VDPHAGQQQQRQADVQEHQQREETVADAFRRQEVAHHGAAEQFGGADRDELRQPVPYQPVAVDAGRKRQPQERHAADPGKPAEAAVAALEEFADQVQRHGHGHGVRRIAVQAADHAAEIPLRGDRLHRGMRTQHAGIEHGIQVQAGRRQDPEEEIRKRTEVVPGVVARTEGAVEHAFDRLQRTQRQRTPPLRGGCELDGLLHERLYESDVVP
jgi:hypothetical protein